MAFGDMEEPQARELNQNGFHYSGGLAGYVKDKLTDYFFRHVTYLVANTAAYQLMDDLCQRKHWTGLLHFYPCLDDEKYLSYGLSRKSFFGKGEYHGLCRAYRLLSKEYRNAFECLAKSGLEGLEDFYAWSNYKLL